MANLKRRVCIVHLEKAFQWWPVFVAILVTISASAAIAFGAVAMTGEHSMPAAGCLEPGLHQETLSRSHMRRNWVRVADGKRAFGAYPRRRGKRTELEKLRKREQDRRRAQKLAARHRKLRTQEASRAEEISQAKLFAARLKRHQKRKFAVRKQDFHKQQLRMERRRRANRREKARNKARQYAEARRHVAEHAPKRRPKHVSALKSRRLVH
jgi:hypothetical protein